MLYMPSILNLELFIVMRTKINIVEPKRKLQINKPIRENIFQNKFTK